MCLCRPDAMMQIGFVKAAGLVYAEACLKTKRQGKDMKFPPILFKDIWPIKNLDDYKIHFATDNDPLTSYADRMGIPLLLHHHKIF